MDKLSFQSQDCNITLAEGLEEYRAYLQANGKKQLIDAPESTIIRDHDATHVIFGLDTSLEQESMLDSWVITGTSWKLKELLAYNKLPELKQLYKDFWLAFDKQLNRVDLPTLGNPTIPHLSAMVLLF